MPNTCQDRSCPGDGFDLCPCGICPTDSPFYHDEGCPSKKGYQCKSCDHPPYSRFGDLKRHLRTKHNRRYQ